MQMQIQIQMKNTNANAKANKKFTNANGQLHILSAQCTLFLLSKSLNRFQGQEIIFHKCFKGMVSR